MEYYVTIAGERTGPFTQFQVIEQIRDRSMKGDELAWCRGMEDWRPLRTFQEFDTYWPLTEEQLQAAEIVRSKARAELDRPQPWLRFWARFTDYVWFSFLVGTFLSVLIPHEWVESFKAYLLAAGARQSMLFMLASNTVMFLLFVPLEALWLARRGTTPGKALLRIQVRRFDGQLPSFRQALLRSLLVFVQGVALCLPLLPFFTMPWCRMRLMEKGSTTWDERASLRVEHGEPELWRYLLVGTIAAMILLGAIGQFVAAMEAAGVSMPLPR